MAESRGHLQYVKRFTTKEDSRAADELLQQVWPDRRETVLIAIGAEMDPQLHDHQPASKLMETINFKGRGRDFRRAVIVTDVALVKSPKYLDCPLITVGGPVANGITADVQRQLPFDSKSNSRLKLQHNIHVGDRRIAVWGSLSKDTADAVDLLISSGILDEFLRLIWGTEPLVRL